MDPMTVQTPALDIIDNALVEVDKAVSVMLKRRALFAKYRDMRYTELEAREMSEAEVPNEGLDRLIISMPPQEGKSERSTHYGALWMLRRHPELRIAIVSYEERIAQRMSYLLRNDLETFNGEDGNFDVGLRLRKDNRSVGSWNLSGERGSVYAIGIGGALTGRPVDLLFIDDPVKDYRAADSSLQSDLAWQWWQSVARARLAPGAPTIVILTRWHEADMAGRLVAKQREDEKSDLKHFDRWHVINISAQADFDPSKGETDPLGREPGEFMISARGRTQAQWEATKAATSSRIWTALYQGKPTPDSGDVFNRAWWRRFETPVWYQEIDGTYRVHDAQEVIQSWDMTFKDNRTSDFVVGQVWARKGANAYLVDEVRARLSFTETVAAVRRLTERWPQALIKLIEDTANGPAVISSLRSEVGGIIPISVKGSKSARAAAVSPVAESGNIFLPARDIALYDVDEFIEECTQFPNAAHDDQVDAMTQALARMFLGGSGGKAWLESLAPPCHECGQPNPREAIKCGKCGIDLEPYVEPEVTETAATAQGIQLDPNQAVKDAIAQYGGNTNGFTPFQRSGW
jgi:predicted phage terminase large subunit-like protein